MAEKSTTPSESKPIVPTLVWPAPTLKIGDKVQFGKQTGRITGQLQHIHKAKAVWRYQYTPEGVTVKVAHGTLVRDDQVKVIK